MSRKASWRRGYVRGLLETGRSWGRSLQVEGTARAKVGRQEQAWGAEKAK